MFLPDIFANLVTVIFKYLVPNDQKKGLLSVLNTVVWVSFYTYFYRCLVLVLLI